MKLSWLAGVVGAALVGACQTAPPTARQPVALAIENVTVIDPETRRLLPHHSVYVDGKRIVAVLAADARSPYVPAKRVNGAGRYLIPGLMDMHVHLFLPEPAEPSLNLLLANGVTGIREMSGDCWALAGVTAGCIADYKALQARIASGETLGPEILRLASTMVMGPANVQVPEGVDPFIAPANAEQGRRLARYLAGRGADLIKTHDTIPRDAFYALLDEARKLRIEVSGHVPFGAGSLGAARRGYGSIEHARDLLYDCSRYGAEYRQATSDFADRKPGATRPPNLVRLRNTVEEYDPKLCAAFLRELARTGVYYVPTHVTREMEARANEAAYRSDPRRKYILPRRNRLWEADLDQTAAAPPEERQALARFFGHGMEVTRMAWRAGVPIMAGTDSSDTMIVPGFSLHRELGLLRRAGLPPMDVLRAATTVPARYLKRSASLGGIGTGKEADLVLLDADPLQDIANTQFIRAVIADGRLYDRAALDALLSTVERAAAAPPAAP